MNFQVLGATGYWYGLCVGVSVLCYLCLAGVLGYRKHLPSGTVRLYGLLGIVLGLLFSRAAYCAVNASYFLQTIEQPIKMLFFWDGGYSLTGALCGLLLAAFLTARICKVRFGTMLDVTAVPMGLLIACVRAAEGFTTLGVGRYVDASALTDGAPWLFVQSKLGNTIISNLAVYRYEAVAALLILAVMLVLFPWRKPLKKHRPGDLALIFFALYGAVQVVLESMRNDGHMMLGFVRAEQLGAVMMPVLALLIFTLRYQHIRGGRWQVALAWLLLPVFALVAWMMLKPINHVLDLTNKLGIGFAVVGALGIYMGFFLRRKGANLGMILTWLAVLGAIAGCVMLEFSIDGSSNLVRDYAMMALCCAVLFAAPCVLWRKLQGGVYDEERIAVRIGERA